MRRRFIYAVLGVLIALAAVAGLPAQPASAHNYDNYSLWYCAKHRSSSTWTVGHSVPVYLSSSAVVYYCRQGFFGVEEQYRVVVWLPFQNNDSQLQAGGVPGYYDRCYPAVDWETYCDEP